MIDYLTSSRKLNMQIKPGGELKVLRKGKLFMF
jgi:hypothetical protein